jgi:transposase-like protein
MIQGLRHEAKWADDRRFRRLRKRNGRSCWKVLKSGNIAETCRRYEIAPAVYYRWKDEVEQAAVAALGGRSAAARPDAEQEKRV